MNTQLMVLNMECRAGEVKPNQLSNLRAHYDELAVFFDYVEGLQEQLENHKEKSDMEYRGLQTEAERLMWCAQDEVQQAQNALAQLMWEKGEESNPMSEAKEALKRAFAHLEADL